VDYFTVTANNSPTGVLTNVTIDGDNNTISNLDLGNEVDWAVISDVADRTAFTTGDKVLIFEAGVGMRKVDYDDLPGAGGGITSLNTLTASTQTFVDDTNVTIVSAGSTHTLTWSGTLADGRIASAATWNAKQNALTFGIADGNAVDIDVGATIVANDYVKFSATGLIGQTYAQVRTDLNVADGANNYSHPNHTGDVTSTGDGATVIADEAVTLAKMAHIATDTFLGRNTAATGDVEVLSMATAKTMLDLTGTNSGDQTSMSGITDTLANFNAALTGADFATLAGTETLTNKTLTTPVIGQINDANGNELLILSTTASAVNEITIANKATGVDATITGTGEVNAGVSIQASGTGNITLGNYRFDGDQAVGAGQDNYVLKYDNATGNISLEAEAGGGGPSFGADNQIPFTNAGGTDFDYEAGFVFDGTHLALTTEDDTMSIGQVTNAFDGLTSALSIYYDTDGTADIDYGITVLNNTAGFSSADLAQIRLVKDYNNPLGSGHNFASIKFQGSHDVSGNVSTGAEIRAVTTHSTWTATNLPTDLNFYTGTDGSGTIRQALQLDHNQYAWFGPASTGSSTIYIKEIGAGVASNVANWGFLNFISGASTCTFHFGDDAGNEWDVAGVNTGSAAPVTTPIYEGELFVDTTNDDVYVAKGIASSADWVQINNTAGGGAPFADTVSIVEGSADASKELRFEVDGFTTATTRVATWPDADGTVVYEAFAQTLTNKTIDGDNNTISNLDLGNEVDWAVISDVADRTAFTTGDKVLIFEAGVGMRKVDYDDLPGAGGGANITLSNLGATAINTSLISDTDITDDLGTEALRWRDIYAQTIGTGQTATDTFTIRGYDTDAPGWTNFIQVTANTAPTCVITNTTINADNNTISGIDLGLEAEWAAIDDVTTGTFASGDKVLIFEAGVGMRKIDYDDLPGAGGGANTNLGNLTATAINLSLISDTDITDDLGSAAIRWRDIYGQTLNTGDTAADTLTLRGRDIDGASWVDVLTITANNTVTADLNSIVTHGGNTIVNTTGTQTLTNKTLTSPAIGTSILDTNGNELMLLTATGSAVNEFTLANAAAAGAPTLSVTGGDPNINMQLSAKGTGNISIGNFTFNADQSFGAPEDNYVLTYDDASGTIGLEAGGGAGAGISGTPANNQIAVWTGTTDIEGTNDLTFDSVTGIMKITKSDAELWVGGTTSAFTSQALNIIGPAGTSATGLLIESKGTNGPFGGGRIIFNYNDGAAAADNDRIGQLTLYTRTSGGSNDEGARFTCYADEAWGASGGGARFEFATQPTSGGSPTLAMTIDMAQNITAESSFFVKEKAAADADVTGYGQFWVRSSDSKPMFTDDGGTDTDLTAGGGGGMVTGVSKNSGANVNAANRSVLNFIEGTNITLTIADDAAGDEVDITIAASGGGGTSMTKTFTAAEAVADGDLCCMNSSGQMAKADADVGSTSQYMLAIATETIGASSSGTFHIFGEYTKTSAFANQSRYYVSTTPAAFTTTAPAGAGDTVRIVGYGMSANTLWFCPDPTYIEI
jgi:hypothetical protein